MMRLGLVLLSIISLKISAAHVQVLIWEPNEQNRYGHAALQTDRYHMSFWPQESVDNLDERINVTLGFGVQGSLHFHEAYDNYLEGEKDVMGNHLSSRHPKRVTLDVLAERLNQAYGQFLRYNEIGEEDVSREAGKNKVNRWLETEEDEDLPIVNLKKTRYALRGNFIRSRHNDDYVFEYAQSCATFCLNLLEASGKTINIPRVRFAPTINAVCTSVTVPEFFNLVAPEEREEDVGIGNTIWNVSRAVWVFLASDPYAGSGPDSFGQH